MKYGLKNISPSSINNDYANISGYCRTAIMNRSQPRCCGKKWKTTAGNIWLLQIKMLKSSDEEFESDVFGKSKCVGI